MGSQADLFIMDSRAELANLRDRIASNNREAWGVRRSLETAGDRRGVPPSQRNYFQRCPLQIALSAGRHKKLGGFVEFEPSRSTIQ